MSEISREDAILNLKAIRDLWDSEYDYKAEYRDFLEDDPIATLEKAISEMEKLEKIKKIVECDECVSEEGDCKHDGDCNYHKIEVIEQIVKGE